MKKNKTQVIGCRLPFQVYENYEMRCIEQQIEMSQILRIAVDKFIANFEMQPNDKTNLSMQRGLE